MGGGESKTMVFDWKLDNYRWSCVVKIGKFAGDWVLEAGSYSTAEDCWWQFGLCENEYNAENGECDSIEAAKATCEYEFTRHLKAVTMDLVCCLFNLVD